MLLREVGSSCWWRKGKEKERRVKRLEIGQAREARKTYTFEAQTTNRVKELALLYEIYILRQATM